MIFYINFRQEARLDKTVKSLTRGRGPRLRMAMLSKNTHIFRGGLGGEANTFLEALGSRTLIDKNAT